MANKTETVRVRMEPKIKKDAEKIFAELGLSPSDAVTMFYKSVKREGGLPFETKIPNASLTRTLKRIQQGKEPMRHAKDVDDLMKQLGFDSHAGA